MLDQRDSYALSYRPTNWLFAGNSSRLMTSMPCFFIIGTTLAATRLRMSLAISSSGPLSAVMNLFLVCKRKGWDTLFGRLGDGHGRCSDESPRALSSLDSSFVSLPRHVPATSSRNQNVLNVLALLIRRCTPASVLKCSSLELPSLKILQPKYMESSDGV